MSDCQPAILQPIPALARYASYTLLPDSDPRAALRRLRGVTDGERTFAGIGQSLVSALGREIPELRAFPEFSGRGIDVPSTPAALLLWLRGEDRGELVNRHRGLDGLLSGAFRCTQVIDAFTYDGRARRDLTGYEDGTENPRGRKAVATAVSRRKGIAGSSFLAIQQWEHDLHRFEAMPRREQDHCFGRRRSDNEELDHAPASAHVKRTAQESFDPEAFVLRRSMPWAEGERCGLVFTAFGASFDAFEALLRRMVGEEDGITDALFRFTRPLSGAYFWCPPLKGGKLDLSALGL
ncbi:MAG: Dyp-type peroxidase [Burkholderiales bacterium]|jgi:putative iron-dependent peroxidase|nr:Dyp-type peroxidase [Burkholderiales bacterium]